MRCKHDQQRKLKRFLGLIDDNSILNVLDCPSGSMHSHFCIYVIYTTPIGREPDLLIANTPAWEEIIYAIRKSALSVSCAASGGGAY